MELYTLDNLNRRIAVIDRYESLIWTERYSAFGDFELLIHSTPNSRGQLTAGTYLALNESDRVMIVETVENVNDNEGRAMLKIKGRSIEKILMDRVFGLVYLGQMQAEIVYTGTPGNIARTMFHQICVVGQMHLDDILPSVYEGSFYPAETIGEPTFEITVKVKPKSLYDAMKEVCDLYELGFRLVRHPEINTMYFSVYTGNNRTTSQGTLDPVIFAPELDNLQNTTELTTIAQLKNVAYVYSEAGFEMVFPDGINPDDVTAYNRNVLLVEDTDTKADDPDASTLMIQKGKEELSKARKISAFDGEAQMDGRYQYGRDYRLGDMVEIRNVDGVTNNMRVTEQIFVSDREGERSYPTLQISYAIEPGTWLGWDYNKVWADGAIDEYWADQP